MSNGIYILLGSNLGDKVKNLSTAIDKIKELGVQCLQTSSVYETAAWGIEDQPSFVNQVVRIETTHDAFWLLKKLLDIESEMGRVRLQKWGERLIDLDILYWNEQIINSKELEIPHPGIPDRRFTLVPLVELDSEFEHPVLKVSNRRLLDQCTDQLEVKKWPDPAGQ